FDDDGDMATEKASSTSALSTPMVVLQDAEEDIPFQKPDKMAQQLLSFFTFGGKNGIADRHEAPLWKHGSPATPCMVSRLAETAGPWEHVALLTMIICSANWMPSPVPTPCNKDLLHSNCYRFLHPPVDWQMPQFDFPLWMFKGWHSSLLYSGNSPLICGFTMPGHNLLALTLCFSLDYNQPPFDACNNHNVLEHCAHETLSIHLDQYTHGRREQEHKAQSSFNTGSTTHTQKTQKTTEKIRRLEWQDRLNNIPMGRVHTSI
ncbi:unnamed protein product, partial [Cylindrotheca closterium]